MSRSSSGSKNKQSKKLAWKARKLLAKTPIFWGILFAAEVQKAEGHLLLENEV
jgi:hypothetical protein